MPIAAQQGRHGVTGQAQVPGIDPGISAADRSLRPGRAGGRVGVTRLVLTDFRNYHSARLDLDPGPVVVTGPNGAGKTNLLEAVSFLSPGRGLRHARLGEIDRRDDATEPGAAAWAVAATVETRRGAVRIGTGRDPAGGERRVIRIDGEPARGQAAHDGVSRLLRDGPADPVWLAALEEAMAQQGVAIAAGRRDSIERLDRTCAAADGPFPRARLNLVGTIEHWLGTMPALEAEERFKAGLARNRAGDALAGGAALGPHRSDLGVVHGEKGIVAENASTGEQKALLIAILLAHAALQRASRGEPPLLLLDEVAAHLDVTRRAALFEALAGLESQVWISGTDAALFSPLRPAARFLSVSDGTLSETSF